jgi:aryl-alcohol dehydrogenase-like predicted oxidoreductase
MLASRLSLGTAQLGLPYGVGNTRGRPTDVEADTILETAFDLGVRSLDTAGAYGDAEERIGSFLRRQGGPEGLEICSKLPASHRVSDIRGHVAEAIESSCRRLGVEPLDEFLVHDVRDLRRHGRALVDSLAEQRERGRVARLGASAYDPEGIAVVLEYPELTVVQHPLNLLDHRLQKSGMIQQLRSQGVALHARSLFLQGLFGLDPSALPRSVAHTAQALITLRQLLGEWNVAPMDVALPFVAAVDGVAKLVIGVDTPEQLSTNIATLSRPLPAGLSEALDERLDAVPPDILDPSRWPGDS